MTNCHERLPAAVTQPCRYSYSLRDRFFDFSLAPREDAGVNRPGQIRIKPGGAWHRRSRSLGFDRTTECGEPITGAFAYRDYVLDGELCPRCHSRLEIDTGEMRKLERPGDGDNSLFFNEDDTPTDPNGEVPVSDSGVVVGEINNDDED